MAQKKKGGFFTNLGKAVDSMASSMDKAASGVTKDVDKAMRGVSRDLVNTVASPLDHLKTGYIVTITARATNNMLKMANNGMVDCSGALTQNPDKDCQFEVLPPCVATQQRAIRLRSVAYPQFHLAILNGYFVGYGQGGAECDFIPHAYSDTNAPTIAPWCVFESVLAPGSHIGVIPTGQFSAPAQTPKTTNAAHFKVTYIGAVETAGQPQQPQTQSQPQTQTYPAPQAQPYPQPQAQPYTQAPPYQYAPGIQPPAGTQPYSQADTGLPPANEVKPSAPPQSF